MKTHSSHSGFRYICNYQDIVIIKSNYEMPRIIPTNTYPPEGLYGYDVSIRYILGDFDANMQYSDSIKTNSIYFSPLENNSKRELDA